MLDAGGWRWYSGSSNGGDKVKRTGEVVAILREHGLKSRRALDVFLDSRPELHPGYSAGRLAWTEAAIARVRKALVARESSSGSAK